MKSDPVFFGYPIFCPFKSGDRVDPAAREHFETARVDPGEDRQGKTVVDLLQHAKAIEHAKIRPPFGDIREVVCLRAPRDNVGEAFLRQELARQEHRAHADTSGRRYPDARGLQLSIRRHCIVAAAAEERGAGEAGEAEPAGAQQAAPAKARL